MRGGKEVCNGSPLRRYAAISWLFGRAILSLRLRFSVSVLALSVTFGDSSPRGRATGVSVGFHAGRPRPDRAQKRGPCYRGQARLRTTSQALRASSPSRGASGETVHFAGTAKASPTRGGGIAQAMTERLDEGKPDREPPAGLPSQSPSVTALPEGEPLACRSGSCWTSKARCLGNGSAPLSRPAAA